MSALTCPQDCLLRSVNAGSVNSGAVSGRVVDVTGCVVGSVSRVAWTSSNLRALTITRDSREPTSELYASTLLVSDLPIFVR